MMMINLCVIGASRIPCMAPELLAGEDMGIPGLSPPALGPCEPTGRAMGSGLCTKCHLGSVGCFLGTYFAPEMTLRAQKQLPGEADIGGELRFAITSLSEVVALTSDTGIFPALVQHLGLFLPGAASGCRKPSAFLSRSRSAACLQL